MAKGRFNFPLAATKVFFFFYYRRASVGRWIKRTSAAVIVDLRMKGGLTQAGSLSLPYREGKLRNSVARLMTIPHGISGNCGLIRNGRTVVRERRAPLSTCSGGRKGKGRGRERRVNVRQTPGQGARLGFNEM